jgi:flagellin
MASNISLSAGVRNALTAIQSARTDAVAQQTKLATGKRVNSALDNPTNFFVSEGLNSRASDLGSLLDSIGQGVKTIEAADKGIKALTKLVESAQGAARQALQSGSTNLTTAGSATALTGGAAKVAVAGEAGNLVVNVGGTNKTFAVAAGDTIQKLVDAVNVDGTGLRAEVGTDNKLKISALQGESLAIDATSTGATATFAGQTVGTVARTAATTNSSRESLSKQFDDLRTQIDQLSQDSGYNGVNLLNGDNLRVQFNEKNTSSITLKGKVLDSTGLGVSGSTNSFQSDSSITSSIDQLSKAVTALRTQASSFGSNLSVVQARQDFTKDLINTLQTGADSLVLADPNEEGAKLVTLNTRAQLGSTALSLASQADQSVLRLF